MATCHEHLRTHKPPLCEWCPKGKKRKAQVMVNLPGNWLPTAVCRECLDQTNRAAIETGNGSEWFPICESCGGSGQYDDVLECPVCNGEGHFEVE